MRKLNEKIRIIKSNSTAISEVLPEMLKVEFHVIESLEKIWGKIIEMKKLICF